MFCMFHNICSLRVRRGGQGLLRIVFEDTMMDRCSPQNMPELFYPYVSQSSCAHFITALETKLLIRLLYAVHGGEQGQESAARRSVLPGSPLSAVFALAICFVA